MSDSDDSYGPALPPGFEDSKRKRSPSPPEDDSYGPALPDSLQKPDSKNLIGPVIPSHLQKQSAYSSDSDSDSNSDSESDSRSYKKQKVIPSSSNSKSFIGPSIPTNLKASSDISGLIPPKDKLSDDDDDDGDDGSIGPSLHLKAREGEQASAAADFDQRAQKMKDKLEGKVNEEDGPKTRESWMTELPSNMGTKFGLENRQFRKNAAPEQDSSWTETPQEKAKKDLEGRKPKKEDVYVPDVRDQEMANEIEEFNKQNRPKSLLEMHQKKMKKQKKKEKKKEKKKSKKKDKGKDKEKPNERRPFDREVDLQVNRLDEAQKRAIIKRSQELGSRFKTGGMGTSFL